MEALLDRRARILSQTGYVHEKNKEFTLLLTCDLGVARKSPDELVIELRRMKSVTRVQAVTLKNQMFDGLLFPLTLMETNRVVAVNSNLMFEIQELLKTQVEKSSLIEGWKELWKGCRKPDQAKI